MKNPPVLTAACAALSFAVAALAFGAMQPGYDHLQHPLSVLGGRGVPYAQAFNLAAFVLPGALLAWVGWRLRASLGEGAGWCPRIGAQVAMLAALAFAAQGLLPLDPQDLDATTSRLHATTWVLWWIAAVSGCGLMAFERRASLRWRLACATTAALVLLCAPLAGSILAVAPSQRVALVAWFAWWLLAVREMGKRRQP
ncbi:DUF998 domain-containing protein [Lysobacter fragariae]